MTFIEFIAAAYLLSPPILMAIPLLARAAVLLYLHRLGAGAFTFWRVLAYTFEGVGYVLVQAQVGWGTEIERAYLRTGLFLIAITEMAAGFKHVMLIKKVHGH